MGLKVSKSQRTVVSDFDSDEKECRFWLSRAIAVWRKKRKNAAKTANNVLVVHFGEEDDEEYYGRKETTNFSSFWQHIDNVHSSSFDQYVSSFFNDVVFSNPKIKVHHVITPMLYFPIFGNDLLQPQSHQVVSHQYHYFRFGENDETEEFVASHTNLFSLILIRVHNSSYQIKNKYTIHSLDALLKRGEGVVIMSSDFSKETPSSSFRVGSQTVMSHPIQRHFHPYTSDRGTHPYLYTSDKSQTFLRSGSL